MAATDALVVVLARNAFYRRLHFLVLFAFLLTLLVIAFLISALVYLYRHPPYPLYFATDNVGRLIEVIPVNEQNMTTEEVIKWTINAVQSAFSNDFVNYRAQLQGAQRFFTTYGWANYMKALQSSNNLVALTSRRMVVVAQVVAPPKIIAQGILAGAYAWKFQMPMLVTYSYPPFNEKSRYSNALDVSTIVQRQPILQSDSGLGIVQVIGTLATSSSNQPAEISGAGAAPAQ